MNLWICNKKTELDNSKSFTKSAKEAVRFLCAATSKDRNRPALMAVFKVKIGGRDCICSTDGRRMHAIDLSDKYSSLAAELEYNKRYMVKIENSGIVFREAADDFTPPNISRVIPRESAFEKCIEVCTDDSSLFYNVAKLELNLNQDFVRDIGRMGSFFRVYIPGEKSLATVISFDGGFAVVAPLRRDGTSVREVSTDAWFLPEEPPDFAPNWGLNNLTNEGK